MSDAVSELDAGPVYDAWAKWLNHSVPLNGDNCKPCVEGKMPREGCEEGVRLYQELADARRADYLARNSQDIKEDK